MQEDENGRRTTDEIQEGDGVAASDVTDDVAEGVVGEGKPYFPSSSFQQQATTLLVYGMRIDGPIGSLLRVAAHALEVAVLAYENEYGEWENGAAPTYEDDEVEPVKWI